MKKIALLLSVALVAGAFVLPAAPARASFAGGATCDVTLDVWPTTATRANSTDCVGEALGVSSDMSQSAAKSCGIHVWGPPPQYDFDCDLWASIAAYNETCVGPLPPPLGTASGTLTVDGRDEGGYNWLRVGLTAIIVPVAPGTSAGVAAFVPHPPIPTCAAPGPLLATVVGVAVAP